VKSVPGIFVKKADGTRQRFHRRKVINTCLRMHASKEIAEKIADKIENRLYDDIPTKKILQMIFSYLKKYRPVVKHQIDFRKAISLLRSKPDFERFIQMLLEAHGYIVSCNQIVRGRCVEHEVDAVATKGNKTYLVEIKHHSNYHIYTGLDVPRIARANLEDLTEGFNLGLHPIDFSEVLVVCNTKFSDHANRYAKCRGIRHIGWKTPPKQGLERMIEEKKFHPVTILKGLNKSNREKLLDSGLILLKQLISRDVYELSKKTKIPRKQLTEHVKKAKEILSVSKKEYGII